MILPFSTQLNGKPTYFPEKIIKGLYQYYFISRDEAIELFEKKVLKKENYTFVIDFDKTTNHRPKLQTIRRDEKNRWQPGTKIDFFINCRQKNMFRFAPVVPVVSTQKITIKHENSGFYGKTATIEIDGNWVAAYNFTQKNSYGKLEQLYRNDGFNTVEDFFAYFNEDYEGKIIHWTDFRY